MTVQPLTKFTAGEADVLLIGQKALESYNQSVRRGRNCIAIPQGPCHRRPGTRKVGVADTTARKSCSFIFGVGDAYTVEFLELKMRFWRSDRTQVKTGADAIYEIVTPWTAAQAKKLRWQRSGDVMWFVHPDVPIQELKRTVLGPPETFTLGEADVQDGPYYSENAASTTLAVSSTGTGSKTVTASASLFDTTSPTSKDIGRHVRIKVGTSDNQSWAWGKITAVASDTSATVNFVTPVNSTGATAAWRLGLYSARTGYASSICIHQERLCLGSNVANSFPRIDCSNSGSFLNFKPGTDDDNAVQIVVGISVGNSGVPVVRDMRPGKVLVVLTSAGLMRVSTSSTSSALTPLNADIGPIPSSTRAGDAMAIEAQGSVLFLDLQKRTVGEIRPTSEVYADALGYREISIRNGHLLRKSPGTMIDWADKPFGLMVIPQENGKLAMGSYAPQQEVINLFPQDIAGGGNVESVNVLPTLEGDDIWLLVERNGLRSFEVLTQWLREDQPDREAVNVDQAVTVYRALSAILTKGAEVDGVQTWTASASVFESDMEGKAIGVLEEGDPDELNMPTWSLKKLRIVTFVSATEITATVEGSEPTSPIASGDALLSLSVVDNLSDFEDGTALRVFADGADVGEYEVSAGAIDLGEREFFYATAGRAYRSEFQPMPPNPQTRRGSPVGRPTGGTVRVSVVRSAGLKQVGAFGNTTSVAPLRRAGEESGMPPPLFTGDLPLGAVPPSKSGTPVAPYIMADGAAPFCIAAMAPDYAVGEAV